MTENAVPKSHQVDNTTRLDRYPRLFRGVREHFLRSGTLTGLKLLSFGCSSGEEVETLNRFYFPEAQILGVDVNAGVLQQARTRCVDPDFTQFELFSEATMVQKGPFDAIFAMSVFCLWPQTQGVKNIAHLYAFEKFAQGMLLLHNAVKPGGLIVIFNANYRFADLPFAEEYSAIQIPNVNISFVEQFTPAGDAIGGVNPPECAFQKMTSDVSAACRPERSAGV